MRGRDTILRIQLETFLDEVDQIIYLIHVNLVVTLLMFSMSMDEIDQSSDRAAVLFDAMYSRLEAALEDWNVEKILKVLPLLIPIFKITTWFKMTFSKET